MAKAPVDLRSLARAHTELALRTLAGIAASGTNEGARVSAATVLLDRGWGKAPQTIDGDAQISVVIRHILEGAKQPAIAQPKAKVIDHET